MTVLTYYVILEIQFRKCKYNKDVKTEYENIKEAILLTAKAQ